MSRREIEVSTALRQKVAALGEAGERWLAGLDELVAEIERDWQITVGKSLMGGSEAFVAEVKTHDGSPAVLKLGMPPAEGNTVLSGEITALTFADGRGYVRLLNSDLTRRALLLEALGPKLSDLVFSSRKQIEIICAALKKSWVKVPQGLGLMNGREAGEWHTNFQETLWQQLGQPCSRQAYETALRFTVNRAKAYDPAASVFVHGDAHPNNTLQTLSNTPGDSTFRLIDPGGLVAEPACDLGVLMREWPEELLPDPLRLGRERCALLSRLTGTDFQANWEWGFIQVMSTGLLFLRIGQSAPGHDLLRLAEGWVEK